MAPRITITESDVLAAIVAVSEAPEDARTMVEIAAASGWSRGKVRQDMEKLNREGRVLVHRVVRRKLDGGTQIVPAYTLAPSKK
jgi:hypothetical protein